MMGDRIDRAQGGEGPEPFSCNKEDLQKCFDTVSPEIAVFILEVSGLPRGPAKGGFPSTPPPAVVPRKGNPPHPPPSPIEPEGRLQ